MQQPRKDSEESTPGHCGEEMEVVPMGDQRQLGHATVWP